MVQSCTQTIMLFTCQEQVYQTENFPTWTTERSLSKDSLHILVPFLRMGNWIQEQCMSGHKFGYLRFKICHGQLIEPNRRYVTRHRNYFAIVPDTSILSAGYKAVLRDISRSFEFFHGRKTTHDIYQYFDITTDNRSLNVTKSNT